LLPDHSNRTRPRSIDIVIVVMAVPVAAGRICPWDGGAKALFASRPRCVAARHGHAALLIGPYPVALPTLRCVDFI